MSEAWQQTQHQPEIRQHGHYELAVPAAPGPHPLLVGFHGYAELAAIHLEELKRIPGAERWILCAVQGPHLFYKARTGEVAASWMTRMNRELAIHDNVAYVDTVVSEIRAAHPTTDCLVYTGFSQGVAMAYRATAFGKHPATGLIANGADVPPDVAANGLASLPPILHARGIADSGYRQETFDRDVHTLRAGGATVEAVTFNGGHEWTDDLRARAGAWLSHLSPG